MLKVLMKSQLFHTASGTGRNAARKAVGRYLLLTNTVACGCLLGAGDVTAQLIEKYSKKQPFLKWDRERTGRLFAFGLLSGPVNHFWYGFLDKILPHVNIKTVMRKIAMDQAIFGPAFIVFFFIGVGLLEGKPFKHNTEDVKSNFIPVYKMDLAVWPAAQLINFYLIPPHMRVLYVACVTFGWSTFLAFYRVNWQRTASDPVQPSSILAPAVAQLKAEGARYIEAQEQDEKEQMILLRSKHILERIKV